MVRNDIKYHLRNTRWGQGWRVPRVGAVSGRVLRRWQLNDTWIKWESKPCSHMGEEPSGWQQQVHRPNNGDMLGMSGEQPWKCCDKTFPSITWTTWDTSSCFLSGSREFLYNLNQGEWMTKWWCIQTTEYYLSIKKQFWLFLLQLNPVTFLLSESSQTQRGTCSVTPSTGNSRMINLTQRHSQQISACLGPQKQGLLADWKVTWGNLMICVWITMTNIIVIMHTAYLKWAHLKYVILQSVYLIL
jgi:hypothetical protein